MLFYKGKDVLCFGQHQHVPLPGEFRFKKLLTRQRQAIYASSISTSGLDLFYEPCSESFWIVV